MKTLMQWLGLAVLVAAVFAILLPVGAKAAQAVSAYITDPVDGTQIAHVDATGALKIGGLVQAQPAILPTSLVDAVSLDSKNANTPAAEVFGRLFTPTQKLALTSLTATNMLDNDFDSSIVVQALQMLTGECGGVGGSAFEVGPAIHVRIPAQQTVHVDFPYPAVFPTGSPSGDWCLRAFVFNSDVTVALTAVGYVQ